MEVKIKHIDSDLSSKDKEMYNDFIKYLNKHYPVNTNLTILFLGEKGDNMSTGSQSMDGTLRVLSKNRLNRDIMRTLAHEWVHAHQRHELGRERGPDIGGQNEDEANAFAGRLIKMFERDFPDYNKLVFEGVKGLSNKINLIKKQIEIKEKENVYNSLLLEMKKIGIEKLPYSYSAMKNFIDSKTMNVHYNKHYKGYVKKLNDALSKKDYKNLDLEKIIKTISRFDTKIRNNAGGAFNHALFWKMLSPKKQTPKKELLKKINDDFGNIKNLKDEFNEVAKDRFGSGWAWLVLTKSNKLKIMSTPNQDNPLMNIIKSGGYPLLGLDLWEHAYYLKYQNKRDEYITKFWDHINWEFVNDLFLSKTENTLNENRYLDFKPSKGFNKTNYRISVLDKLCRMQKDNKKFCELKNLSKQLDDDNKVDLEVSMEILDNYFRYKNIGLFPRVVELALENEGRTVNYLGLLASFIEDDAFDESETKKVLNKQRNSKKIPVDVEDLLKQARSLEHQKYESRFYGDYFEKDSTFLKLDYKCGDNAKDTLFELLTKVRSKEKTIDIVYEQIIRCVKGSLNNGTYYLKSDVKSKKPLKYDGEVIFEAGTNFEIKKMDPFIDSYLSEFFSIFKESALSVVKGEYLNMYNELIQRVYDWLANNPMANDYLEKVKSQIGGIIYDYDTIVPIEYIDLYWSNKGQRGCDEKRLSIRFKIKNGLNQITTYRFSDSDELTMLVKNVPNSEKQKVICN
jgi:Fe-Mn family superoxide dismutase